MNKKIHLKFFGWCVHALTATAGVLGVLTLYEIHEHDFITAFWLMGITILIDAVDGSLARLFKVEQTIPHIDGALLDNTVDFINYVITPCFFLYVSYLLLPDYKHAIIAFIVLASAYQFCQKDAKTSDHFFKGFPCYWNLIVFYEFIYQGTQLFNSVILLGFALMVFIPIKYIYPSRVQYISNRMSIRVGFLALSIIYGFITFLLLYTYPNTFNWLIYYTQFYIALYFLFSFYRNLKPLPIKSRK